MARIRKQKVTPRALLDLKMPGEVQVAPDGVRVAYGVSETDWSGDGVTQHLFVLKLGDEAEPRQVTRGAGSETQPRWSPDGKWLAFLSDRDDEGGADFDADADPSAQVWLLPMDGMGGEAEKLTDAPEGIGDYEWLPGSTGVVYLAQEPRPKPLQAAFDDAQDRKDDGVRERAEKFRHQIWHIDLVKKKPVLVHPGDYGLGEIAVSPDGLRVAFTTNYTGEPNDYHRADVWVVGMDGADPRPIANGPGGKFHPLWTRDGSQVLFVAPLDPALSYSQSNLYAVPAEGEAAAPTCLTETLDHDITDWPGVHLDAAGVVYVLAAVGTTTQVFRQSKGGGWEAVVDGDGHVHDWHIAPDGGVVYTSSSSVDVPELVWLTPKARRPETLTDLNADWADGHALCPTSVVSWTAPDGLEIEGLLTLPLGDAEGQKHPLVVSLHGGPHGRTVQALSPYTASQVWAGAGYAVLSPNYRGSEGYGNLFSTANRNDLGGADVQDILAGIDQAIAEGIADPERLAVIGASYGGYLVNWLIARTDRFQAAVSQFGIFSLVTDFSNSQAPRWEMEYLGGSPWERPEIYAERSPSTYVQNIHTPVLILHGEGDPNTLLTNSHEMYQGLHLLGRTAEYVHYPREGHGLGEPQHRLDELRRCLAWFDKYLLGGGTPTVYRTGEKIAKDDWELTVTGASLESYAGHSDEDVRYVEVTLALHDRSETRRALTLTPADFRLARTTPPGRPARPARPVGLPLGALGQRVLAEGGGWAFRFAPGPDDRALSASLSVTFRLPRTGGTYHFTCRDFPPVALEVPAAEKKDDKEDDKKEGA